MPPLTPERLEERRTVLGGTDMAAIAGMSPWARPIDVFYDKRPDLAPLRPERPVTTAMQMGHRMEDVVAGIWSEQTGVALRRDGRLVRCPDHSWEGGNLDRRSACGGIFEAKWSPSRTGWGDQPTTELHEPVAASPDVLAMPPVPPAYYVQVQWYLHVARRGHGHLAVVLGYGEFRHYTLWAHPGVQKGLVDLAHSFWHDFVLPGVAPPPDGSDAYGAALRARWPSDTGEELPATPEQVLAAQRLREVRADLDRLAAEDALICQRLQVQMRDATAIRGPGFRVTWRQNQPTTKVDWEAVAGQLGAPPELVAAHTSQRAGARPFRVTFDSDKE